jgi:low temperature requirement protein LtrA
VFLLRGFLTVSHLRARHLRRELDAGAEQFLTAWIALEVLVTTVWGVSLLVPEPGRYGLWTASLVLSVAGMTTIYLSFESLMAPETSHCNERLGLFTILVLGETILAVGVGVSTVDFTPTVLVTSALGFAVAVAVWWLYFYRYDERIYDRLLFARNEHWSRLRPRGITHVYAHVLVHAGIVVTGVGIAVTLESVFAGHALATGGRLALCVGPATFLLGSGISQWATPATFDPGTAAGRLAVVALLGLLAALGGALAPSALIALVVLSLLGLVVFEGVYVRFEPRAVAAEGA